MYVNKKKYGECEWIVLENAANKELFLRDPPPVLPEFCAWFSSNFPSVENRKLVKAMIYRVICSSAKGEETVLNWAYLAKLLNLAEAKDYTVTDVITDLCAAFNTETSEYSRFLGRSRTIQIEQDRAIQLQKEWTSFSVKKSDPRYLEAISPTTGESIHSAEYSKTITESKICIRDHQEKKYKKDKHVLYSLIKYLNARKIPQVITDRLDILIENADPSDIIRYNRLTSCRNNLIGGTTWQINDQGYRVFPRGESLATLKREDRWAVMLQEDGFYEIDLTNAHFAILAFLIQGANMMDLLNQGSIWPQLLQYIGKDSSFKDSLKECIYSMLYGSGEDMQKILLIQDPLLRQELKDLKIKLGKVEKTVRSSEERSKLMIEKHALTRRLKEESTQEDKDLYTKLTSHPAIKELLEGSKLFGEQISEKGSFKDAYGIEHSTKDFKGIGKIMNTIMTSYEKKLMAPIYNDAMKTRYFEVIIDQHDGCTLSFNKNIKGDPEVRKNVLNGLKEKVDQNAKELGLVVNLSIKNG